MWNQTFTQACCFLVVQTTSCSCQAVFCISPLPQQQQTCHQPPGKAAVVDAAHSHHSQDLGETHFSVSSGLPSFSTNHLTEELFQILHARDVSSSETIPGEMKGRWQLPSRALLPPHQEPSLARAPCAGKCEQRGAAGLL